MAEGIRFNGKTLRLKYTWRDVRDLCDRLGTVGAPCSMVQLLRRLGELDPSAITAALLIGLAHSDKKLSVEKIEDQIDAYLRDGGRLPDLMNAVLEGLQESGAVYVRKEADATENPPN